MNRIFLLLLLFLPSLQAKAQNIYTDENDLVEFNYSDTWTLIPDDGMAPGITNGEVSFRVDASLYTGLDRIDIQSINYAEYRQMLQYSLASALNTVYDIDDYGTTTIDGKEAYFMIAKGTQGDRAETTLYFLQTQTRNSIVSFYIEGPENISFKENNDIQTIISTVKFNP